MAEAAKKEKEQDESFDIDAWTEALSALGPGQDPTVTLSTGKKVAIKKVTAAQLYLITDLIKHIIQEMNITSLDDMNSMLVSIEDPLTFVNLIGASIDKVIDLIAALCDLGEQTVKEGLDLDDLMLIGMAEWKRNQHFFTTRLLPMIQKLSIEPQLPEQAE